MALAIIKFSGTLQSYRIMHVIPNNVDKKPVTLGFLPVCYAALVLSYSGE
jgi:hypothetical protein